MTEEELIILANRLKTQDNRITANPLYCVQQKRRIYGIDLEYDPQILYQWAEDPDYSWETREEAEQELLKDDISLDDFEKYIQEVGYIDIWEFVTAHLTEKAAQLYIDQNKHNLKSPRIFVSSQYRCHEFNNVIEHLKNLE